MLTPRTFAGRPALCARVPSSAPSARGHFGGWEGRAERADGCKQTREQGHSPLWKGRRHLIESFTMKQRTQEMKSRNSLAGGAGASQGHGHVLPRAGTAPDCFFTPFLEAERLNCAHGQRCVIVTGTRRRGRSGHVPPPLPLCPLKSSDIHGTSSFKKAESGGGYTGTFVKLGRVGP